MFETWLAAHRARTGALPDPAAVSAPPPPPDSTGTVSEVPAVTAVKQSLRRAVAAMDSAYGADGARWRWQHVQQAVRPYPFFTTDTTAVGRQRFAPVRVPDGGHPTAIAWGPSLALPGTEPAAVWSAEAAMPRATGLRIRHRDPYAGPAPLASERPVEPRAVRRSGEAAHTLRLLPEED